MAITLLKKDKYQVKVRGFDGGWLTKVFPKLADAKRQERKWKQIQDQGTLHSYSHRITVAEFFKTWIENNQHEKSRSGWKRTQAHYARDHILPLIGHVNMQKVTPAVIERVLNSVIEKGLAPKTQSLIYGTLRKVFSDAHKRHRIIQENPVSEDLKPVIPDKEAPHLNLIQAKGLLDYVRNKPFDTAIWLQTYLGLRVGEVQALRWNDVDLYSGIITIRNAFVNRTKFLRDYPKGGKQHTQIIPADLLDFLKAKSVGVNASDYVVGNTNGERISYRWYFKVLQTYCKELEITEIGTHGLRHTASILYLSFGANKEDLQHLFAHSSMRVTEKYIHNWNSHLKQIAPNMRLFS